MKKVITGLIMAGIFTGVTIAAAKIAIDSVAAFAYQENQGKTALVQERIQGTKSLLEELSVDPYIRSREYSYQEKAVFLTDKNQRENLGYMMLRLLDGDINIYREDAAFPVSNLASRDYMQRLYSTGEEQVTDAFLAGADGKTINYTVTAAIKEDGRVTGALMAAIYGEELDVRLQDERSTNVLVGSLLQYMGGVPKERFGLSVSQALEGEHRVSRPVENILLDFTERKSGSFWSIGSHIQHIVYSPVEGTDWVVMTEVRVIPLIKNVLTVYGCGVAVLMIAGVMLLHRKKTGDGL